MCRRGEWDHQLRVDATVTRDTARTTAALGSSSRSVLGGPSRFDGGSAGVEGGHSGSHAPSSGTERDAAAAVGVVGVMGSDNNVLSEMHASDSTDTRCVLVSDPILCTTVHVGGATSESRGTRLSGDGKVMPCTEAAVVDEEVSDQDVVVTLSGSMDITNLVFPLWYALYMLLGRLFFTSSPPAYAIGLLIPIFILNNLARLTSIWRAEVTARVLHAIPADAPWIIRRLRTPAPDIERDVIDRLVSVNLLCGMIDVWIAAMEPLILVLMRHTAPLMYSAVFSADERLSWSDAEYITFSALGTVLESVSLVTLTVVLCAPRNRLCEAAAEHADVYSCIGREADGTHCCD